METWAWRCVGIQYMMEKHQGQLEVLECARQLVLIDRRVKTERRSHFFLAGFHLNEGNVLQPHAYFVNKSGHIDIATTNLKIAQKSFWLGSGGRYAFMYFHGRFRPDMTTAEAVELAGNAVYFASTKCPHTDFGVQLMIIQPGKEIKTFTLTQEQAERQYTRWLKREKRQLGKFD
ncbi:uncharacterized protein LOC113334334 isoform X1 [Papaver somniferum]|uniref:uncharacterized protein LOC113334334 isoform X1 n=2 Tax=Papaver somniferum TaxID=3469 RepID=UPI000E6FC532|nr:uncharacterized protein LOC113334334 isoform X1 [Papaver somniferum]